MHASLNQPEKVQVGKVPFVRSTLSQAVSFVLLAAQTRRPLPIRLSNAYCVALASKDAAYQELLSGDGVNFADGTPVVWAMRRKVDDPSSIGRVRGPSLFRETLSAGRATAIQHFLLGSTPETLDALEPAIQSQIPGVIISGKYSPPFAKIDQDFIAECTDQVLKTKAQLVWVALGTPKQDHVAAQLSKSTGLPTVAVGAAFDFVAGTTREAPKWIQESGIEWAYRFAAEPTRLWRRYTIGNFRFLASVIKEEIRR